MGILEGKVVSFGVSATDVEDPGWVPAFQLSPGHALAVIEI